MGPRQHPPAKKRGANLSSQRRAWCLRGACNGSIRARSHMNIETGTSSMTITIEAGGCEHEVTIPLNCMAHNFKHLVGRACRRCYLQFWYPTGCDA